VTGHPNTEEETSQSHCHDGDNCCCIHRFAILKVYNVHFDDAKLQPFGGIRNHWL
jgi:hypothetical protein